MTKKYQPKLLADGTPNPHYKSRYQSKTLPDGSLNPLYKNHYQPKVQTDGTLNPRYMPDIRTGSRHTGKHAKAPYRGRDEFVAIDGEGATTGKVIGYTIGKTGVRSPIFEHRYILLMSSRGDCISNPQGLTTQQCFDFLLGLAKKCKHAIFVGFGLSYDINQMIRRGLDKEEARELWTMRSGGRTERLYTWYSSHGVYRLGFHPRKDFFLGKLQVNTSGTPIYRNVAKEGEPPDYKPQYETTIRLWDAHSFFQSSFVKALEQWFSDALDTATGLITFPDGQTLDLARMKAMKRDRRAFTTERLDAEIAPYCLQETVALQKLMERLRGSLSETGIALREWNGAGAAANALLRREKVKEHLSEDRLDGLHDAQLRAFSGGRMELSHYGVFIGPCFNYDLHSAYPSVMPELPSLTGGRWRHIAGASKQPYSLSLVRWRFDEFFPWYPLFFRDSTGAIYAPCQGLGWYWRPEVDAAMRAWESGKLSTKKQPGSLEVLESWEFYPASDAKPFAFVPGLYEQRRAWKEAGNPAEKVIKFSINSINGKFSQSLGGTSANPPAYHNIGLSGFIMSTTRARLFDAIMQNSERVIIASTDGLYSTVPLDLPLGDGLGQWEETRLDGLVVVQSGVFWRLRQREQPPTDTELAADLYHDQYWQHEGVWYDLEPRYQGYDRGAVTPAMVVEAWRTNGKKLSPTLSLPATRCVMMGSALANPELWPRWGAWRTIERTLKLYAMGRRITVPFNEPGPAHERLIRTYARNPSEQDMDDVSFPYSLKWAREPGDNPIEDGVPIDILEAELAESQV